jgi:hypothetical protein
MRADKEKPKPPEPPPAEGADITRERVAVEFYRAGYEDAARDFLKGVLIGTMVFVSVKLLLTDG